MPWKFNPFTKRLDYYETGGGGGGFQPLDADLTAISALAGTGIACRTAADTWALRNVVDAGSTRVTVTNPGGVAGNITLDVNEAALSLANLGTKVHASLTGLAADDHPGHPWLAGRPGGQTQIGSTLTGEDYIVRSNALKDGRIILGDDIASTESVVIHGTSSTFVLSGSNYTPRLTVHDQTGLTGISVLQHKHSNTAGAAALSLWARSRGTEAAEAVVQDADFLARLLATGYDGTDYATAAMITAEVNDPTPSATSMGGALGFHTVPQGSTTPTERVRIAHDGKTYVYSGLYGGFAATDHLSLYANDDTFTAGNTGRIRLFERVSQDLSATVTTANFETSYYSARGTWTINGISYWSIPGFDFRPVYAYDTATALANSPGIYSSPTYRPTAAVLAGTLSLFAGFWSDPIFDIGVAGAVGMDSISHFAGFASSPRTTRTVAGTLTIPSMAAYMAWNTILFTNHVDDGATVTDMAGFFIINPVKHAAATITRLSALRVGSLSAGLANMSVYSESATVHMRHAGPVRIGDSGTTPTDMLEVVNGNVVAIEGLVIAARTLDATTTTIATDEYSFASEQVVVAGTRTLVIEGVGRLNVIGEF